MPGQRIEDVPIDALSFGLSPRTERYDPKHVAALTEVLDKVPPILVHAPTSRVIDGVHRVRAAHLSGRKTIRALMFEGGETEARIEAVRSNVVHGKPLSLAERETAAVGILELVPSWSDRRIADVSGLSPKTVARLRERATDDSAQLRARIGRDGRARPVDPSELRHRIADAVESDPDASNRAIARRTGASQATVRDVRERLKRGESPAPSGQRQRRRHPGGTAPGAPTASTEPATGEEGPLDLPSGVPAEFADWFESSHVNDADWQPFVDAIPIGRVYDIADASRRRGESWRAFAVALEDRARQHRRSSAS